MTKVKHIREKNNGNSVLIRSEFNSLFKENMFSTETLSEWLMEGLRVKLFQL